MTETIQTTIAAVLAALESSRVGVYMRESGFGFVPVEIVHVLALSMVFGSIAMIDLRLIGVASRRQPVTILTREVLPITWCAFAVAIASGGLMFVSKATSYYGNLPFRLKMLVVLLAGVNMAAFHLGPYRHVETWDRQVPPPPAVRLFGAVSLGLWIAVIFLGRWIGFIFELELPQ